MDRAGDIAGGVALGLLCLVLSMFTLAFRTDAGASAPIPVGFAAVGLTLIALDVARRGRRRRRYRIALAFALAGTALGLAGIGVRLERVSGAREGRILAVHVPPFASFVRARVEPAASAAGGPASASADAFRIVDIYPIRADGTRAPSPRAGRLEPIGAHVDVTGAATRDGRARVAFGYEIDGPDGRAIASAPLPPSPGAVAEVDAPEGTVAYHALLWPGIVAPAGRYEIRVLAWDATSGARRDASLRLAYERPVPAPGALVASLVFTQPDHEDRAQPGAAYASGDTVEYDVLARCPAGGRPLAARATLEPLAPMPGAARVDQGGTFPSPFDEQSSSSLPPPRVARAGMGSPDRRSISLPAVACTPDSDGLAALSFYIQGANPGRFHLALELRDPTGGAVGETAGDFAVLPPGAAAPATAPVP